MKLEPVLTMKIVDNFVRFGIDNTVLSMASECHSLVPRPSITLRGGRPGKTPT